MGDGNRAVLVSGSRDQPTVAWDASTTEALQVVDLLGPAQAVVVGQRTMAVAVGSAVCTFAVDSEA